MHVVNFWMGQPMWIKFDISSINIEILSITMSAYNRSWAQSWRLYFSPSDPKKFGSVQKMEISVVPEVCVQTSSQWYKKYRTQNTVCFTDSYSYSYTFKYMYCSVFTFACYCCLTEHIYQQFYQQNLLPLVEKTCKPVNTGMCKNRLRLQKKYFIALATVRQVFWKSSYLFKVS